MRPSPLAAVEVLAQPAAVGGPGRPCRPVSCTIGWRLVITLLIMFLKLSAKLIYLSIPSWSESRTSARHGRLCRHNSGKKRELPSPSSRCSPAGPPSPGRSAPLPSSFHFRRLRNCVTSSNSRPGRVEEATEQTYASGGQGGRRGHTRPGERGELLKSPFSIPSKSRMVSTMPSRVTWQVYVHSPSLCSSIPKCLPGPDSPPPDVLAISEDEVF